MNTKLHTLTLILLLNAKSIAWADPLTNCLLALETTQYTMDFSQPIKTRKLTNQEKKLLRDFAEQNPKYKNDPKALEALFQQADAITQEDNIDQVLKVMSYHIETGKDLNSIKKELEDISLELTEMWEKPQGIIHLQDTRQDIDRDSAIIHQRAKFTNEKLWKKFIQHLKEKGDTPKQIANKLETLMNSDNFDGNFLFRYDDIEKALQTQGRTIGFGATETLMKPTTDEVFLSYLFYLGVMKPQGKGLSDLYNTIETVKKEQGSEITNVGNLLYWTFQNISAQKPDQFSLGNRIISIQDYFQQ